MKKQIVLTVIIILLVLFATISTVTADQGDSVVSYAESDLQELPEMDMTGLHTDIELIEIDPEITAATVDWIVLAHDDAGKISLIDDIDTSDLSDAEKIDVKKAVNNLWKTYPTKFEDAGEKTVDIQVQSDGLNRVVSIPVGHVTRITFDKEKIRETAKDENNVRLMSITDNDKSAVIVLSEAENSTIKNITGLRMKKTQEVSLKNSNPSSGKSDRESGITGNSYSSGFSSTSSVTGGSGYTPYSSDGIGESETGLMAWSGSHRYNDPVPGTGKKDQYTGHNNFTYDAAIKANLQNPDTAAMAARYPDDVIDNENPTPLEFSWLDTIWHSWNHGYIPYGTASQGKAPERCAENAAIAQIHYTITHDYVAAAAYFGNASHYLTDVGNPMHTGRALEQFNDIQIGYNTHAEYETYVENNWITSSTGTTPYGEIVSTNNYYYSVSDPNQATKNLAAFSNTYLDTLYYRVRNNVARSNPATGFPADPTVRLITENCVRTSSRYAIGLAKYVKAESTTNSPPAADFTYIITSYDGTQAVVLFTDSSIGQVDTRDWDFGDNKPHQSAKIVTHTYYPWNDYRAVLTVSNAYGTTQKKMDIPANHVPPSASFVYTPSDRLTYQFIDTSTGINADCNPTSWEWDFGDDSPVSFEQNPIHKYEWDGLKPIKFTAKNIYGNSEAFAFPLYVQSPIEATIIHAINQFTVHFSAQSTVSPSSYEWNFDDGTTSTEATPTHEYSNPGTYNVKLTVKDPYYDDYNTTELSITVPSQSTTPEANFAASPRTGSTPLTVQFTDTSTNVPGTWFWSFGDGGTSTDQNPSHQYLTNGTFTVSLTATNSTSGSSTKTKTNYITVGPLYAETSGNYTILKFNTTGSTKWTPPPGVTTVDYLVVAGGGEGGRGGSLSGEYYPGAGGGAGGVKNGSSYTVAGPQTIVVGAGGSGPAGGSYSQGYPGGNSVFNTITSTGGGGGGGGTGVYTGGNGGSGGGGNAITNTAGTGNSGEGNNGGIGNYTMLGNPAGGGGGAGASGVSPGLSPYGINQGNGGNGRSIDITGTPVNYGGGGGGGYGDPSTSPGIGGLGCGADGSMGDPLPVKCQGTGAGGGGSGNDKHGAGGSGVVIIRYTTPVEVVEVAPTANFTGTPTSGNAPLTVTFTDLSTGTNIITRAWDFNNDGTVDSTVQNPAFTYSTAGTYTVRLTVTNATGGSNTIVKSNYITVTTPVTPPFANFTGTPTSGSASLTVQFTDLSTGTNINTRAWDFNNDGTVDSTVQNPAYTYSTAGTYSVKLTVTNATGSSNTTVKSNYITVTTPVTPPVANFTGTPTSGNAPLTVTFTDLSTGTNINTRAWDFNNDGTVDSTVQNPAYTYSTAGTYSVRLTITNATGSSNTTVKSNYITVTTPVTPPVANFTGTPTSGNSPLTVMFTDLSTGTNISTRAWDFNNDGTVDSAAQNPSFTYSTAGTYSVKLTVTNAAGSSNTTVKSNYITVTSPPAYMVVTFNTVGSTTWTPPSGVTQVDYLVVAGGGSGGGYLGGGGGAGGVRTGSLAVTPGTPVPVTVGAGGGGSTSPGNGGNSVFGTITSLGGGYGSMGGGWGSYYSSVGGSGGGGGSTTAHVTGSEGTAGQGYAGGNSLGQVNNWGSGGGGGASAVGASATSLTGGNGGNGSTSSITGTAVTYGGGGGGAVANGANYAVGLGGTGGGGKGSLHLLSNGNIVTVGTAGTNGLGGGGGGGGYNPGDYHTLAGGSGAVIIRYSTLVTPPVANFTASPTSGNASLTVHFTDTSTGTNISTWAWDFNNDGTVDSAAQNPSFTYTTAGTYTVKLTVTNATGSSNTTVKNNYITVATPPAYMVVTFNTVGSTTWTPPSGVTQVEYLVVGGGGSGGGYLGGGGGAGGVRTGSLAVTPGTPVPVTVGAGGGGSTSPGNGGNSVFGTITSLGGGYGSMGGGWGSYYSSVGGSGGGGGSTTAHVTGSEGTAGQGYAGGNSLGQVNNWGSGGGGGASAVGASATSLTGGNGGAGLTSSITGTAVTYGGGGGGAVANGANYAVGLGGTGGGGKGSLHLLSNGNIVTVGTAGTNGLGGGGGGGGYNPGDYHTLAGGSGVVIIRYSTLVTPPVANFTGTPTSGNASLTVQFTDTSTGSPPLTYAWDFNNDGTVDSTVQNPSYTYATAGTYTVKLTVTNSSGSTNTMTKTSYITVSPPSAYTVVTFNTVGSTTWTPPSGVTQVEYLVVGGGGSGGGYLGGGGGAGGVRTGSLAVTPGTPVPVTVGAGGGGSTSPGNGGNSVFGTITSLGGGYGSMGGGWGSYYSSVGGSGGGGGSTTAHVTGSAGTAGQGYAGGNSLGQVNNWGSGGGGGASAVGASATSLTGGNGGAGLTSSITGTAVTYGGGGGGAVANGANYAVGLGGTGGGGKGSLHLLSNGNIVTVGTAGTNGLGGGGGGGGYNPGDYHTLAGGSGVVIIRYLPAA